MSSLHRLFLIRSFFTCFIDILGSHFEIFPHDEIRPSRNKLKLVTNEPNTNTVWQNLSKIVVILVCNFKDMSSMPTKYFMDDCKL